MNLKQSRFISISLSPTLAKAAQVSSAGVVEKLAQASLQKGPADVVLRQMLTGFDTQKSGILCAVPGDVATVKNIEVPSVEPEEIESILALQASRHTPFSKDEILTSYIKLGSPRPNFTRVLLVIVKRDAIKERLTVMKAAGLNVDAVVFVPEAVSRFYTKTYGPKKGEAPLGLIDLNRENSNFMVLTQGTAAMSRNIPVGFQQIAADADAAKQLVEEIKASLSAYEEENGAHPVKFYLTLNHPGTAGLDLLIGEGLGGKVDTAPYPVLVNASKSVRETIARDFADESALDVIASAAMASKCEADLVPQEIRDQRSIAEKGRETLKAGIFVLLSLFFIGGALLSKVYFKDQFLKQNLVAKYAEQRQDVLNLENMITKTRTLRQYLEGRDLPLESVRELYRIIPTEIYLSSISMDETGTLSVQGVSDSMSKVFGFVTALEESPFFEGVKTKSTATKKDRGKDVATFEIVMKVSPVEEAAAAAGPKKDEKK